MKDTKKILRTAIKTSLASLSYDSVPVPVYDEKVPEDNTYNRFIILSTQLETPIDDNDCTFVTSSSIDIEIYDKTETECSKDPVDTIYESIMETIIPTPQTIGLPVPSGFQFLNPKRESCVTQSVVISTTQTIIIEKFKLVFTIIQQ